MAALNASSPPDFGPIPKLDIESICDDIIAKSEVAISDSINSIKSFHSATQDQLCGHSSVNIKSKTMMSYQSSSAIETLREESFTGPQSDLDLSLDTSDMCLNCDNLTLSSSVNDDSSHDLENNNLSTTDKSPKLQSAIDNVLQQTEESLKSLHTISSVNSVQSISSFSQLPSSSESSPMSITSSKASTMTLTGSSLSSLPNCEVTVTEAEKLEETHSEVFDDKVIAKPPRAPSKFQKKSHSTSEVTHYTTHASSSCHDISVSAISTCSAESSPSGKSVHSMSAMSPTHPKDMSMSWLRGKKKSLSSLFDSVPKPKSKMNR